MRGIGKEAPKELRDARRSLMDGETERLCIYGVASAMLDRVAGTSMELNPISPLAFDKLLPSVEPLLLTRFNSLDLVWVRGVSTPKSESSKAGMVNTVQDANLGEICYKKIVDRERVGFQEFKRYAWYGIAR